MSTQPQWGVAPGISQPIDPAPLRLPIAPQWGTKTWRQMPPAWALAKGHFYGVPYTFINVPARGTAQVNVQYPFSVQAWGLTAHSTDTSGAGGSAAPFTLYIIHLLADNQGERIVTPFRVTATNMAGTGKFPAWLKVPQLILKGESLQIEISSESTAQVNQIQVLLHCTLLAE